MDILEEVALGTLYAAKKYMLPDLEKKIRQFQVQKLSTKNIWNIYTWSIAYSDDQLRQVCRAFLTKNVVNTRSALAEPAFRNIPLFTLQDLLHISDGVTKEKDNLLSSHYKHGLFIAEIEIFKACNIWAEAECVRQEIKPNGSNKKDVLKDCLDLIRFASMLKEDLIRIVSPTEILSPEVIFRIMRLQTFGFDTCKGPVQFKPPTQKAAIQPFIIYLQDRGYAKMIEEISQLVQCTMKYSAIKIKPKERLLFTGIWIDETAFAIGDLQDPNNKGTVEVAIVEDNKKAWIEEIKPQKGLRDSEAQHLIYVAFEEVQLKAGHTYLIKVETETRPSSSCGHICHNRLSFRVKLPADVNLEILDYSYNYHISGLTARLA